MSEEKLPYLNREAPLSLEDFYYLRDIYEEEFLQRLLYCIGYSQTTDPSFGIVDGADPTTVTGTSTARILVPTVSDTDGMRFDVSVGFAVTDSGFRIVLSETQDLLDPPITYLNGQFVVFLEYATEDDPDTVVVTDYNTDTATQTKVVDQDELVKSVSMADWNDVSKFPASRVSNCVPLAIGTVLQTATGGSELSFNYTRTVYSWNRPWFSVVDTYHRTQLGTGTQTSNNPHALSLADLGSGLTIYQQILPHGIVLSKDFSRSNLPGILCQEDLGSSRWFEDTDGSKTGIDPTVAGTALYAKLQNYPIRSGRALSVSTWEDVAAYTIPGTNLLILRPEEKIILAYGALRVYYMSAYALQPSILTSDLRVIEFGAPSDGREVVISGGLALEQIPTQQLDLGILGPIPTRVRLFCDGQGNVITAPQCLVTATILNDVTVGVSNKLSTTLIGDAHIRVGLADAHAGSTLSVKVKVTGKDSSGNALEEELAWEQDNYVRQTTPDCDGSQHNWALEKAEGQVLMTVQPFSEVTGWTLTENVDSGPASSVVVHAMLSFPTTQTIKEYCPIADIKWDGLRVCDIRDIRPVNFLLAKPTVWPPVRLAATLSNPGGVAHSAALSPSDQNFEVTAEDMTDRYYDGMEYLLEAPPVDPFQDGRQQLDDRWAEGIGHVTTTNPDSISSQAIYTSRAFVVPRSDGYDSARLILQWDNGPEFSRNMWSGFYSNHLPLVFGQYRYSLGSDPSIWKGWEYLISDATSESRTNFWHILSPTKGDPFYRFQVRLNEGNIRGWSLYWEDMSKTESAGALGVWEITAGLVGDGLSENTGFELTAVSATGASPAFNTFSFTYKGQSPDRRNYTVWIEGKVLKNSVTGLYETGNMLERSGVTREQTPGQFTVMVQDVAVSNTVKYQLFVRVKGKEDLTVYP